MTSMCMREATSGNTPPYWACLAACEATMLDRIVLPSATTAAAVSSQEVSMARILGILGLRPLDLQHQVFRVLPNRFKFQRLRVEPDAVFDADAITAFGIVQPWLQRHHHARFQ